MRSSHCGHLCLVLNLQKLHKVAVVELVLWPCNKRTRVEDSVDTGVVLLLIQMI